MVSLKQLLLPGFDALRTASPSGSHSRCWLRGWQSNHQKLLYPNACKESGTVAHLFTDSKLCLPGSIDKPSFTEAWFWPGQTLLDLCRSGYISMICYINRCSPPPWSTPRVLDPRPECWMEDLTLCTFIGVGSCWFNRQAAFHHQNNGRLTTSCFQG